MPKKRKKKPRQKLKKGLDVIMDWIQKQKPKDLVDAALNVGLAYAGYETFKDWKGALLGPVSLKLAQTSGGTPPVAQIAGVAGLSLIGVKGIHDWVAGEIEREKEYYMSLTPEEQRKWVKEKGEYFLTSGLIYEVSPFAGVLKAWGLIP